MCLTPLSSIYHLFRGCQIGPITCIGSGPCRHTNSHEKKVKNSTGYQFPVYQQTYDKIRTFCHRREHITVY